MLNDFVVEVTDSNINTHLPYSVALMWDGRVLDTPARLAPRRMASDDACVGTPNLIPNRYSTVTIIFILF